jgi:hypothetical protein
MPSTVRQRYIAQPAIRMPCRRPSIWRSPEAARTGLSGGGLLVGWTAAGTRPTFKAVTGISTGALTAPFAFLGPDYDDELKEVYTTISAQDVLEERGYITALFQDALADNARSGN